MAGSDRSRVIVFVEYLRETTPTETVITFITLFGYCKIVMSHFTLETELIIRLIN